MENNFQSDLWLTKAKELYNIQQERKQIEKIEKELSEQLKELQHHEPLSYGGLRYYFEISKGSVDYSLVPQLINVDLEPYRKASVKRWKLAVDSII